PVVPSTAIVIVIVPPVVIEAVVVVMVPLNSVRPAVPVGVAEGVPATPVVQARPIRTRVDRVPPVVVDVDQRVVADLRPVGPVVNVVIRTDVGTDRKRD